MATIIIGILFVIFILFMIQRMMPVKGVSQINAKDLKQKLKNQKQYQFIDVRTPSEFNRKNIKGFKNIPLSHINQQHHELSKDKEIVLICRSGSRSNTASRNLKKLGYAKLANVKGGIMAWKN